MTRKYSVVAMALTAMISVAQGQQANPGTMMQGGPQYAPPANIYVVNGFYGTGVYVVPSGGLLPPPGTAGVSLAGQAGLSMNTPIDTGLQSTLGPRPVVYGLPLTPTYAQVAPEMSGRLINDFSPSYAGNGGASAAPPASLGELAAAYKARRSRSRRVFTNADADRFLGNSITIRGTTLDVKPAPIAPVKPEEAPTTPPPPRRPR
jgi:hypothetical protein